MRMAMRTAAVVLAAAVLGGCNRGAPEVKKETEAHQDSVQATSKSLQDSGVSVDTLKIDTGGTRAAPVDDN
jgi:PBP1b-binding outer membrane lipoprotein LpoB